MQFEGRFEVAAPREKVWNFVSTPDSIIQCVPGLQEYRVKGREILAKVKFGIGFIKGTFSVNVKIAEEDPKAYTAKLLLNGSGAASAFASDVHIHLTETTQGTTFDWKADAKVSGPLGTVASSLLEGAAKKIIKDIFDCMRTKLA